jgi:hypothetical protein
MVTSVFLCNTRLPVNFRYALVATRSRGGAICREGPTADIERLASGPSGPGPVWSSSTSVYRPPPGYSFTHNWP